MHMHKNKLLASTHTKNKVLAVTRTKIITVTRTKIITNYSQVHIQKKQITRKYTYKKVHIQNNKVLAVTRTKIITCKRARAKKKKVLANAANAQSLNGPFAHTLQKRKSPAIRTGELGIRTCIYMCTPIKKNTCIKPTQTNCL